MDCRARAATARPTPPVVKPNNPAHAASTPPRKKRAPRHNQARKRETPTRTVTQALDHCPDCHYPLWGERIDYTRQVIELPPPVPVEIVEHRVIKRWCPVCHQRWHSPKLDLWRQGLGRS